MELEGTGNFQDWYVPPPSIAFVYRICVGTGVLLGLHVHAKAWLGFAHTAQWFEVFPYMWLMVRLDQEIAAVRRNAEVAEQGLLEYVLDRVLDLWFDAQDLLDYALDRKLYLWFDARDLFWDVVRRYTPRWLDGGLEVENFELPWDDMWWFYLDGAGEGREGREGDDLDHIDEEELLRVWALMGNRA
jgi:hypothetical protein